MSRTVLGLVFRPATQQLLLPGFHLCCICISFHCCLLTYMLILFMWHTEYALDRWGMRSSIKLAKGVLFNFLSKSKSSSKGFLIYKSSIPGLASNPRKGLLKPCLRPPRKKAAQSSPIIQLVSPLRNGSATLRVFFRKRKIQVDEQ